MVAKPPQLQEVPVFRALGFDDSKNIGFHSEKAHELKKFVALLGLITSVIKHKRKTKRKKTPKGVKEREIKRKVGAANE